MSRIQFTAEAPKVLTPGKLTLVAVFEGTKPGSEAGHPFSAAHSQQAEFSAFSGQHGKTMVAFSSAEDGADGTVPLFYGLGKLERLTRTTLNEALIAAFKAAKKAKASDLSVVVPCLDGTGVLPSEFAESVALLSTMVDYEINHFKTELGGHKKPTRFASVRLQTGTKVAPYNAGLNAGQIIASAINNTRDLVNLPPSMCTPSRLVAEARKLEAKLDGAIKVKVLNRKECEKLGMDAYLAVSRGSTEPPKFIELTYEPAKAVPGVLLGLVGKSVTFDSGGLDIKGAAGMLDMKCDMAGGATVLSAIGAIAALKLPIRVKAFMAATENMPGPNAYKPGDVIFDRIGGMSIEVNNTDAEGRLTLIDAISYAKLQGCTHLVDLATLTGAILTALADVGAGLFTNNQWWADNVKAAASESDEMVWQMPMWDALKKGNDSEMADLKNSGGSFGAGSSTAALFIGAFAGKTPWVHLDIAGVAHRGRELGADPKGGTGWGVRTLVQLARQLSSGN